MGDPPPPKCLQRLSADSLAVNQRKISTKSCSCIGQNVLLMKCPFKVTAHSNNRNSKSSREVILGSVRLRQSVILRNYDMFSTDSNARYTARW